MVKHGVHQVTAALGGHCANRYGTSFTAAALKWLELTDQAAVLAVARDGFIYWLIQAAAPVPSVLTYIPEHLYPNHHWTG
ncbi:hypothetical protein [Nitrosovibrio sp. Nv4]|uniref:hypothetical protein n=1 Tax=Nitrosovibrio sp. Nv4 TaxID=1945880 RepID=UPI000BE47D29|nr:hypothetical protein [Nitrosovibrio sp. Nv4]